ncbi:transcriptional regulator [Longilinea arvoryzae]|uniref:Transcriptional regulator n=1 Tax=Longilinea arvoryzae TaxID=360412 RepID=A0A0K8MYJ8_9CHLR|nr:TetR/AcrR family transcriptional regulator [Longilinea arvoryzae]GAP16116.1 transcriptional regulator [Longilinea arvoryzae]
MESNRLDEHETARCILEEGWQLFQQKGYRGVSIDELCLRCKLSKPTLYYYFQDKENLFVQILQYKLHGFREIIERPGSLRERLQAIAAEILDSFQTDYSSLLRDREHLKRPENLVRIRDAFHNELFGPMIALMQAGIDAGELRRDDPTLLALIFMGSVNNFIGKAADLHTDNPSLAGKLTDYYIEGSRNRP